MLAVPEIQSATTRVQEARDLGPLVGHRDGEQFGRANPDFVLNEARALEMF